MSNTRQTCWANWVKEWRWKGILQFPGVKASWQLCRTTRNTQQGSTGTVSLSRNLTWHVNYPMDWRAGGSAWSHSMRLRRNSGEQWRRYTAVSSTSIGTSVARRASGALGAAIPLEIAQHRAPRASITLRSDTMRKSYHQNCAKRWLRWSGVPPRIWPNKCRIFVPVLC